jgi:hypothetical protein
VGVDEARDESAPAKVDLPFGGGRRGRRSDPVDAMLGDDDSGAGLPAQPVAAGAVAGDELADTGDHGARHG